LELILKQCFLFSYSVAISSTHVSPTQNSTTHANVDTHQNRKRDSKPRSQCSNCPWLCRNHSAVTDILLLMATLIIFFSLYTFIYNQFSPRAFNRKFVCILFPIGCMLHALCAPSFFIWQW
jgi:hypothetical protein